MYDAPRDACQPVGGTGGRRPVPCHGAARRPHTTDEVTRECVHGAEAAFRFARSIRAVGCHDGPHGGRAGGTLYMGEARDRERNGWWLSRGVSTRPCVCVVKKKKNVQGVFVFLDALWAWVRSLRNDSGLRFFELWLSLSRSGRSGHLPFSHPRHASARRYYVLYNIKK